MPPHEVIEFHLLGQNVVHGISVLVCERRCEPVVALDLLHGDSLVFVELENPALEHPV